MAINFLNTVDLNKNSLDRAVIQNLTADPTTGNVGQIYYNTVDSELRVCVTADTAAPTNAVWSSISGDITEVQESLVNGLLGINVLNPTGPIPVVGLDIAGLTALGTGVALTDSLAVYDLDATTNKSITVADIVGKSTWLIEGDGANPQTIVNGDTVDIVGSTYISSVASAIGANDFAVTLTHDATTRNDTTSAVTANVFSVVNSVSTNSTGHVTAIDVKTVTVPDNNTTYTLPVSAGTAVSGHSVADIDLTDSTPTIVSKVTYAGLDNEIKITETTGNNGIINIALADGAYVDDTVGSGSNLVLPDGAVAVTQATADNSTKIATTEFVKLNVTGLLQFVGGFNANTGDRDSPLTGDLYTDVQLFVGDYYVVTTAGDFFGNTATPLTAGDSVIVQSDAAAGAAVEADFIVVQSDTDLATATTPGLGFVTATATSGIDVSYAANNGSAALTLDACELPSNAGTPVSLVGCDSGGNTKKFPIATVLAARGKKLVLEEVAGNGIVNSGLVGGVTTYTITLATAWQIDGSSAGVDGTDVQVEVTGSGQTVYAEINRTTTTITVAFTGAITDGDYVVLLNNVG